MNQLKKAAAVTALLLLGSSLTACHFSVHIGNDNSSSAAPAETGLTADLPEATTETAERTTEAASAEAPAAETAAAEATAPAESEPDTAESAICGKWAIESLDGRETSDGQFGSEDYRRLFQMEFQPDGKAVFYERGSAFTAEGGWSMLNADTVQLMLSENDRKHFYPLDMCTADWHLDGDTMTAPTAYLGELVIRKTEEFAPRSHPETAWLAGNWICTFADENTTADTSNLRWEISTVADSVIVSVSSGGDNTGWYFAQIKQDGSLVLALENGNDETLPFAGSMIRQEPGSAVWSIERNGYGTLKMTHTDS